LTKPFLKFGCTRKPARMHVQRKYVFFKGHNSITSRRYSINAVDCFKKIRIAQDNITRCNKIKRMCFSQMYGNLTPFTVKSILPHEQINFTRDNSASAFKRNKRFLLVTEKPFSERSDTFFQRWAGVLSWEKKRKKTCCWILHTFWITQESVTLMEKQTA